MNGLNDNIQVTNEVVTELESLEFFQTRPHQCSYLETEVASTAFINPRQRINKTLYSQLSELGFRRSGRHVYKPVCAFCSACIPIRIPVSRFVPKRQQKRVWKRNQDLTVTLTKSIDSDEHYDLYECYIQRRHADGDMFPPSRDQFTEFLTSEWGSTRFFEFRHRKRLIATSIADIMDNGISAIYTYYDPNESRRSLGTWVILYLIELTRRQSLPSLYLGYWIESSAKMRYKSAFRPMEIRHGKNWILVP